MTGAEGGDGIRRRPTTRTIIHTVYVPSFLFAIGQGAVLPFIALRAEELGASLPTAGLIFALQGAAMLLFDVPAGALVSRIGEYRAMTIGMLGLAGAALGCALAPTLLLFGIAVFALGATWSLWFLARLTYAAGAMPARMRGRALSTLGGVQRMGRFLGPLAAAVSIPLWGIAGAFYVQIAVGLLAFIALHTIPDPDGGREASKPIRFTELVVRHGATMRTAGAAVTILGALRSAQPVIISLWGSHVGLDPASIGVIFAASSGLEVILFYPAGSIMDRWGRRYVAIPCAAVLSIGYLVMPLSTDFTSLLGVALLSGFGNGIGSGIGMTLGSDVAPLIGRAEFLGMWRVLQDVGRAGGPLLFSGLGAITPVAVAVVVVGVLGVGGAIFVALVVPETLTKARTPD